MQTWSASRGSEAARCLGCCTTACTNPVLRSHGLQMTVKPDLVQTSSANGRKSIRRWPTARRGPGRRPWPRAVAAVAVATDQGATIATEPQPTRHCRPPIDCGTVGGDEHPDVPRPALLLVSSARAGRPPARARQPRTPLANPSTGLAPFARAGPSRGPPRSVRGRPRLTRSARSLSSPPKPRSGHVTGSPRSQQHRI